MKLHIRADFKGLKDDIKKRRNGINTAIKRALTKWADDTTDEIKSSFKDYSGQGSRTKSEKQLLSRTGAFRDSFKSRVDARSAEISSDDTKNGVRSFSWHEQKFGPRNRVIRAKAGKNLWIPAKENYRADGTQKMTPSEFYSRYKGRIYFKGSTAGYRDKGSRREHLMFYLKDKVVQRRKLTAGSIAIKNARMVSRDITKGLER